MKNLIIPDWDKHETGIYFIVADDVSRVKIGKTTNIERRIREISNCSPIDLRLAAYFLAPNDAETFIHKMFSKYRLRGEWFTYSLQIKNVVKRLNTLQNVCFMDCLADHDQEDYYGSRYEGMADARPCSSRHDVVRYS